MAKNQTTTTQPWAPTIPSYKRGISDLDSLYGSGGLRRSYGPSRVAGLNTDLTSAWDATANRARNGNPLLGMSQDYASDVLSGKYLTREAPGFSDVLSRTRDLVNANASAGSRYASGAHTAALGRELGALEYENYLNERGLQHDVASMAPELAAADYYDLDRLGEVGGRRQAYDQLAAEEAANRFAFEQQVPEDAIARYLALLPGGLGSVSTAPAGGGGAPAVNPWLAGGSIAAQLGSSFLSNPSFDIGGWF